MGVTLYGLGLPGILQTTYNPYNAGSRPTNGQPQGEQSVDPVRGLSEPGPDREVVEAPSASVRFTKRLSALV